MVRVLRFTTEPKFSGYFFAAALFLVYGVAPLAVYWLIDGNVYMLKLGLMTCAASALIIIGFRLPFLDRLITAHRFRLPVPLSLFQMAVWGGFLLFFAVTIATADAVPLISALTGNFNAEALDVQRGAFLKTRDGWEASLGYVGGVFAGTLLPFALAMLLLHKARGRFLAMAVFIVYSLSFLQKALFIQVVTPPAYLAIRRVIWNYAGLAALLVGSAGLLYLNTMLARGVQDPDFIEQVLKTRDRGQIESGQRHTTGPADLFPPQFFTAQFYPASSAEHLVWRAVAVPIFTAADSIKVFEEKFEGRYLYGATSSFVAAIFRLQRVNYDAEVYASQWGSTTVGRANSVFTTEAFVNFGWPGVVLYSLLVGLAFRVFARSESEAVRSMWPLFAYNIIQASLIGTLLSSGFALLFLFALFVRFTGPNSETGEQPVESLPNIIKEGVRVG